MCADTRRPERDYLAWLRPERLDVSDAYGASGRRIFFLVDTWCRGTLRPDAICLDTMRPEDTRCVQKVNALLHLKNYL